MPLKNKIQMKEHGQTFCGHQNVVPLIQRDVNSSE